jgi:hypothetical protein
MTITDDDFSEVLMVDFGHARKALVEARRRHQQKDTAAYRSAVRECQEQIDRVLDMYLEVVSSRARDDDRRTPWPAD